MLTEDELYLNIIPYKDEPQGGPTDPDDPGGDPGPGDDPDPDAPSGDGGGGGDSGGGDDAPQVVKHWTSWDYKPVPGHPKTFSGTDITGLAGIAVLATYSCDEKGGLGPVTVIFVDFVTPSSGANAAGDVKSGKGKADDHKGAREQIVLTAAEGWKKAPTPERDREIGAHDATDFRISGEVRIEEANGVKYLRLNVEHKNEAGVPLDDIGFAFDLICPPRDAQ